jgi:D-alanyl-D-alanine carboxypeptidase
MNGVLQGGRRRRHRPGGRALAAILALAVAIVVGYGLAGGGTVGEPRHPRPAGNAVAAPRPARIRRLDAYATRSAPRNEQVRAGFRRPPASGLLFDVRTGRVLWSHRPDRVLEIASLTKMMTALLVVRHVPRHSTVLITREALAYQGSGVGVLPRGRRIDVETMLYGLLLPSGNDAAIALAQRVARRVPDFVAEMNAEARTLGLRCSHFTSPDGFLDRGNHSCAPDLAVLAREILHDPRLRRIVRTRHVSLPFPIRGGRLDLYNNNRLVLDRYPGVDGVKTGFTDKAGRCLVAAAHRGDRQLGVVLLHSPDPPGQARTLLDRGFAALRRAHASR